MTVIATAGHVDHGKSSLVRALTGVDPDRLQEERDRGLTIDLGFAEFGLPGGGSLSFVDVPGHARFIRNMLAGVGSVQGCCFVVAATEGWKPQSEEHLRILDILGVRRGVVALTKADLVDEDLLELAALEVAEHTQGTFLAGAPVVPVDSRSGHGLTALVEHLALLADAEANAELTGSRPRLWIDRSFSAKGAGTVVTGTLSGGSLQVDDRLVLHPPGREVRVRGLQRHGVSLPTIAPAQRCAVNLTGIGSDLVPRGAVLVRDGQWHLCTTADAELSVLPALTHAVARKGSYLAYVGSEEVSVTLRVLHDVRTEGDPTDRPSSSILPGRTGLVRLHFARPLTLVPGDRFVLRDAGRDETVGGGRILDVDPVRPTTRAQPTGDPDQIVAERGWVDVDEFERLAGHRRRATIGNWVVDPSLQQSARAKLSVRIIDAADAGVALAQLDERDRALLTELDNITVVADRAYRAGGPPSLEQHPYLALLRESLFAPPEPTGVDRSTIRELIRQGLVFESEGQVFAREAVAGLIEALTPLARESTGFTVSDARQRLATSRKYAVPLLVWTDGQGITRRQGAVRVAGPRWPRGSTGPHSDPLDQ